MQKLLCAFFVAILLSAVGVPLGRGLNTQVSSFDFEAKAGPHFVTLRGVAALNPTLNLCVEVGLTSIPEYPAYWDT